MSKRHKRPPLSIGAFRMIEDSFSLLRQNFGAFGLPYSVGTGAFLLYFAYFVEDLSFGVFDTKRLIGHCFAGSFLYVWMRAWQCIACEQLRRSLANLPEVSLSFGIVWRSFVEQGRVQGLALWFWFVSLITFLVGFGWGYAYGQCLVAQGRPGEGIGGRSQNAWRITSYNTGHVYAFVFANFSIWMIALLNAGTAFSMGPSLLRQLLGVDLDIAVSGWQLSSTTFTTIVFSLCYFITDAFAKSYFSQLSFYGLSRRTGEDIVARFSKLRSAAMALVVFWFAVMVAVPAGFAEERESPRSRLNSELSYSFDQAADEVLAQEEFAWRLPRLESSDLGEERGFLHALAEWLDDFIKSVGEALSDFLEWLLNQDSDRSEIPQERSQPSAMSDGALKVLMIVGLIALGVGIVYAVARWDRNRAKTSEEDELVEEASPDLEDEGVHAAQLPSNRWLSLAIDKSDEGDYRLAIRAVFLASLALFGDRRVLRLAKHKSNFDYERELRRRALPATLLDGYNDLRLSFDEVWYGNFDANLDGYENALSRYRLFEEELPQ